MTLTKKESCLVNYSLKVDVRNHKSPEALYFLCKRESGGTNVSEKKNDKYFKFLTNSIAQCRR
jgi:hypothetical protein